MTAVLHGANPLGIFVGNLKMSKSFFECHDQFHRVHGVAGQVLEEVQLQAYFPAFACLPI